MSTTMPAPYRPLHVFAPPLGGLDASKAIPILVDAGAKDGRISKDAAVRGHGPPRIPVTIVLYV